MNINEERDIILNALYHHFEAGRITQERLFEYLLKTELDDNRIISAIEELVSSKYINEIPTRPLEYQISPKGKALVEKQTQERDLSRIERLPSNNPNKYPAKPHEAVIAALKSIWEWINKNSFISALLSGIILFLIIYFSSPYLDKKYKPIKTNLPPKSTTITVKKL